MKKDSNNKQETKVKDFTIEYNEIFSASDNTVVIETQWEKEGDFFQKFSMYDNSYIPAKTLGNTTLINNL